MTCSDLTIICVTKGEECCENLLAEMTWHAQDLGAMMIFFLDGATAFSSSFYACDRGKYLTLFVRSGGYIESVLDAAVGQVQTRYVLRLDDDERMSPEMISWLSSGAYRAADHWKFPRAHLWQSTNGWIFSPPLWPDHQTRLSTKEKAGGRNLIHAGSPFGGGKLAPCYIEHHKFLIRSREEREEISARYQTLQPGAGSLFRVFSVPEEFPALFSTVASTRLASKVAAIDEAYAAVEPAVDLALDRGAFQHRQELLEFCTWLVHHLEGRPVNVLEIGTLKGGTAILWHEISKGKVITVDMPDGRFGGADHGYDTSSSIERGLKLHADFPRIHSVLGDSHDSCTFNKVAGLVNGQRNESPEAIAPVFDLLFVDGDHTLSGVRQDYEMYSPLVRPGGIIAFHDVTDTPMHRAAGCEVPQFFASLSGDKRVSSCGGPWGGIGAIIKSTK